MLVLRRKKDESIFIGTIEVKVTEIKGNRVTLAIDAPREVSVKRGELMEAANGDSANNG